MNYGYSIYDMESYGWNCCGVEEYISSPKSLLLVHQVVMKDKHYL